MNSSVPLIITLVSLGLSAPFTNAETETSSGQIGGYSTQTTTTTFGNTAIESSSISAPVTGNTSVYTGSTTTTTGGYNNTGGGGVTPSTNPGSTSSTSVGAGVQITFP